MAALLEIGLHCECLSLHWEYINLHCDASCEVYLKTHLS